MKRSVYLLCAMFMVLIGCASALADELEPKDLAAAQKTIEEALSADSGLKVFFEKAAGYAVYPKIAKGAIGVGGAHGKGVVFDGDKPVGVSKVTQVTVGLQLGGKTYSEIVFFETEDDFTVFRTGRLELAAQASAVALTAGASADLGYSDGVAIVVFGQGGLMYEASVGGQKFSYKPLEDAAPAKDSTRTSPPDSAK